MLQSVRWAAIVARGAVVLGLAFGLGIPTAHAAEGFTVWLENGLPEANILKRADRRTGPARHMAHVDLAFPPQPVTPDDDARYDALRKAVADGKARWDEFDVEYGIAVEIEAALAALDVMRDERDRQDVTDARLFQGAAVVKAFDPSSFLSDERAAPFRASLPGMQVNRPWFLAMAQDPDREFTRADVADGSAFPELQALLDPVSAMSPGVIDLANLPKGTKLFIDGRAVEGGAEKVSIRPGLHFVHALRDGVVSGRQIIEVIQGASVEPPVLVDRTELDQARAQVLAGTTTGLPEDVKTALEALASYYKGPIFVAAISDKGAVEVLPYARGAKLVKRQPVTVLGTGEIGGGAVISRLFDKSEGENRTAPAVMGSLGVEIGIYYGAILGGCDLAFTPANTVTHGNADETDNVSTSVMPQPWGGIGVYVLRPTGISPTLLFAGTYGWEFPAHLALGGRVLLGIPIDKAGTWFRLAVGGVTSSKPLKEWRDKGFDMPMHTMFLRFGLAARF